MHISRAACYFRFFRAGFFPTRLLYLSKNRNLGIAFLALISRARAHMRLGVARMSLGRPRSQPRQRFFDAPLPILPPESLMRGGVPADGLVVVRGALFDRGQFVSHHGVASLGIQLAKFRRSLGSVLDLADAGLYLPPVSHVAGLYQSSQPISQQAPR